MTKLILAAAAAAALFAGQAFAAEQVQTQTVVVPASAVDFNNAAQVKVLYQRIDAAAREACSMNSANPALARPERECYARAVADAVRNVNRPLLTAAYDQDRGPMRSNSALAINDQ